MKKIYNFTLILTFAIWLNKPSVIISQNLVPNFGFEIQDTCPAVSQITLAPPWNSPTIGTPDLFNSTCATQNSPGRTGIGSSGVFCYSTFPNNREYIQAPLTSPLVAGQAYCVTFYVKRSNYRYAVNRIGAYLCAGAVNQMTTSNLNFTPQVENNPSNMLSSTSWMMIYGSFIASGGEDHILIGNFSNDANTDTLVVTSTSSSKVAFYKIDDVKVEACTPSFIESNDFSTSIFAYPSPANDFVNFKFEIALNISDIILIDLSGKVIKDIHLVQMNTQEFSIDISRLPEGIYLASFQSSYGRINKKFAIAK